MSSDDAFEIFLDEKNEPWIRVGADGPERSTFAEALRRHADIWDYQTDGHYGDREDYKNFFRLIANKLPEGV